MILIQLAVELFLFFTFVIICFYFPGKYLSSLLRFTVNGLEDLFFSTLFGLLIFTLFAYIFSWVGFWWILIPAILFVDFLALRRKPKVFSRIKKHDLKTLAALFFFAFIFSLPVITSGQFGDSVRLIGVNRMDGLWHIALINELRVHFPPDLPQFSGVKLIGYHFFYNFLLAKISSISTLSPFALLYHCFPLLIGILWATGVFSVMYEWTNSKIAGFWAVFLTMFGGSFGFVLWLQGHKGVNLDSVFGIHQPAPSQYNYPYAFSVLLVIGMLFALQRYFSTKSRNWLIPLVLCVGLATMFKVYAGMILLGGLTVLSGFEILFKRKFALFLCLIASGLVFLGTYWVFADHESKLIWYPLWAPYKTLQDNLPWYGYEEKMYTYTRQGVLRGVIETQFYALFVFFVGSLGTRSVGLLLFMFFILRKKLQVSFFTLSIFILAGISISIPLFFIQSGQVFEIIQIAWYFLFFCALIAAAGFGVLFSLKFRPITKLLLLFLLLILTLPSAFETYKILFQSYGYGSYPKSYFQAAQFLANHGPYDSITLELPGSDVNANDRDLRAWYYSQPIVTELANKRGYVQFVNHTFPKMHLDKRLEFVKQVSLFAKTDATSSALLKRRDAVEKGLSERNISYIFSSYDPPNFRLLRNTKKIFSNDAAVIYRVGE